MKLHRSRIAIIAACAVAGLGAVALTGCGGGSTDDAIRAQNREFNFSQDRVTLAVYCQAQVLDGSGDYSAASDALDRVIKITRNHPDQYRSGLTDIAQNLNNCDHEMSQLVFNVLATLPA